MKLRLVLAAALLFPAPFTAAASALGSAGLADSPALSALAEKAILPGTGIAPQFSDPGRVKLILKTVESVYYGAPLPFPKDGAVFENRQSRLPAQPKGYYREYTLLPPPGSPSTITVGGRRFVIDPPQGRRGAERLIIGGGEVLYYSPDHYTTFLLLQVLR